MEIDLNRLQTILTQVSLDGFIDVIKLVPKDEYVIADLSDSGRIVGVYSIFSRSLLPLDTPITVSSNTLMKVIKTLFKYNPIAKVDITEQDITISNSDTTYLLKQRSDVVLDSALKPTRIQLGKVPEFDRQVIAEYSLDADALSNLKSDEDVIEILSKDSSVVFKFRFMQGETMRMFSGQKPKEDFDVTFDFNMLSKIVNVLNGKIVVQILKGKYYQLHISKPDKDFVLSYLMIQRAR